MSDFLVICLGYVLATSLLAASLILFVQLGRRFGLDEWMAAGFGFVCLGCAGYAGFLIYLLSVPIGTVVSLAYLAVLIVLVAHALWTRRAPPRELAQAMALAALFGFLYLSLLLAYVPKYSADVPAEVYFEFPRPHDQKIPLMFAEAIHDRLPSRVGKDLWGWYFSDRPPLQAGFVLLFSPIWNLVARPIAYQAIATALQTSCLIAAWLLLRTLGFRYRETLLAVLATGASGFLYYNSVYAWPKLLTATFVLVAIAPLAKAFLARKRPSASAAAISAAAAALAMLAHGGAIYSLVPLAILLCLRIAHLFSLRALAIGAAAIVVLYGPWIAYGRYVDPNTSRMFKEHLTGSNSPEPFWQALFQAYRDDTAEHWALERLHNARKQFRDEGLDRLIVQVARGVHDARLQALTRLESSSDIKAERLRFDLVSLGALLRTDQREIVFRALGLLNVAWPLLILLLLLRRRLSGVDPPLVFLLALNVLTSVWWSIAEFVGGTTVITHSSFAMVLIAFLSATIILARVSDRFAMMIAAANAALSAVIWVVLAPGPYWSEPRNNAAVLAAIAGAAAIVAFAWALFRAETRIRTGRRTDRLPA